MADAASNYLSRKTEPPQAAQVDESPKTSAPAELPRPQIPKPLPSTPVPPIDPSLFEITNPHHYYWEDNASLLDLGDNDDWQIKDACEGVLIMGAPGSGKTSGSGFAIASAFLMSGFGGLVLCAKTDEARRWQKLCSQYKREQDCIVITRDSPHKLNILAYETFHPRIGLTDDLITFFRELISIVGRRSGQNAHEDFWINATNQLMRALFDVFLLAKEPMTVDNLVRFVTSAPESPDKDWSDLPYFADVMDRAKQSVQTDEDRRVFSNAFDYWANVYPGIAPMTRSGITLGFTAMADALKGRGIHALISTETTLTPESILSGKIVILDLPLKECGQGGMLVQAAWKYLFQRAVERRADKGQSSARPVFLWEDEAHLFFSQHDVEFQPTARDCRAAHVLISQSLHNFYQLGHNVHAVQAVLATLNTQIFHANGDLETNKWASEKIGTTLKMHVSISIAPEPQQGFWDQFRPHKSNTTTSLSQQRESVLQPEAFLQLKKGGDGITQAVILWVSHAFASNKGQPFTITTFEQQPIL